MKIVLIAIAVIFIYLPALVLSYKMYTFFGITNGFWMMLIGVILLIITKVFKDDE